MNYAAAVIIAASLFGLASIVQPAANVVGEIIWFTTWGKYK